MRPASSTRTRSARRAACALSWVTSMQVSPWSRTILSMSALHFQFGGFVECGSGLVEQQGQRRVGQGAGDGDSLGFASGKIGDVAAGIAFQADPSQQLFDGVLRQRLSTLLADRIAGSVRPCPGRGRDAG